jgi:predicted acylesterase/phospholipase RssA/CRP-like cAMP-binding protein
MSNRDLDNLVSKTAPFSSMSLRAQGRVAALLTECMLSAGDYLTKEGDYGDSLYIVAEGLLSITKRDQDGRPIFLGKVGAGEVVGELALLTGHPRAATIIAEESCLIAALSLAEFELLTAEFPQDMEQVVHWMQGELHRYQILSAINKSSFFGKFRANTKIRLTEKFGWLELHAGDVLFHQGDLANQMFFVVTGRIQLLETPDKENNLNGLEYEPVQREFGEGDVLGAMSIITGQPHSATAYAIRDTQVAVLDRAGFDLLAAEYPQEILQAFARRMKSQVRAATSNTTTDISRPSTVAVLVYSSAAKEFSASIADALGAFGPILHLKHEILTTVFPNRGLSPRAAESRLSVWLNEQETTWSRVVYEATAMEGTWTLRCLRQADILLVVAEAEMDPDPVRSSVQSLLEQANCRAETNLVLLHPGGTEMPRHTKTWVKDSRFKRHWHACIGNEADAQRIARFLDGRAVGLTLGGGMAFGLAHIGVIEALRDLRVPIDYVGGTSMGAIVGAGCALGYSRTKISGILKDGCTNSLKGDYTLPLVSLLSGKKLAQSVGEYIGDHDLEDFWLPYFAVSASLVHAKMIVHKNGSALRSVLASSRVPGLFPPLCWDQDVLVDGGLVNNVPCDVMRDQLGSGTVIGVDVARGLDFSVTEQFDLHHSGWKMVRRRFSFFSPKPHRKNTTMASIFQRVVRLGGVAQLRHISSKADLYLTPPLREFGYRDFHRGEEMSRKAYGYTVAMMQQWIEHNGRPWTGTSRP